jgi:hypothetical protein
VEIEFNCTISKLLKFKNWPFGQKFEQKESCANNCAKMATTQQKVVYNINESKAIGEVLEGQAAKYGDKIYLYWKDEEASYKGRLQKKEKKEKGKASRAGC